ncbi:hypothetical protein MPSEU_000121200 [Mayamaea pseudoterrestris]|nr:hypothetical protein MPSEU_000121200 [Mayamaea pseudoterrestris]
MVHIGMLSLLTRRKARSPRIQSPRQQQQQQQQHLAAASRSSIDENSSCNNHDNISQQLSLSHAQQTVFLNMQLRRLTRSLKGTQRKSQRTHHVALFVLLVCVYGLSASYMEHGILTTTLVIRVWQMVAVGAWFMLVVVLLSLLEESIFFSAVVWMFVYWPLMAIITSILITGSADPSATRWITAIFVLAQCLTLCIVVTRHYLYPMTLQSKWFFEHVGVEWFWKVQVTHTSCNAWTMIYQGSYHWTQLLGQTHVHSCHYQGEFDAGTPHGAGRWMDDSHGGEVLSGTWLNGNPVAPFLSRRYGTGDAFRAVPVAYFMATDDAFAKQQLFPTNRQPARCGVASVECSVQGAFYNHLPEATEIYGPNVIVHEQGYIVATDDDNDTPHWLQDCFDRMAHLVPENDTCTMVAISSSDSRGVHVQGHVYAPSSLPYSSEVSEIVIRVKRDNDDEHEANDEEIPPIVCKKSDDSSCCSHDRESPPIVCDNSDDSACCSHDDELGSNEQTEPSDIKALSSDHDYKQQSTTLQHHHHYRRSDPSFRQNIVRLEVQDWLPSPRKEALVFIPGFNSCLKRSLQTLGQLLAMTKISARVYPIVFEWPVGQILTYRYASAIAASNRNKELFLQLMRGLSDAGIDHVHFMSHSMGVQTLLGAFQNKADGSSSDVSKCFQLATDGDNDNREDERLMTCKSITMLNPDFSLAAFVDHAFLSIRSICDHITIVGDRGDQALFFSQFINGTANYLGYSQPALLNGANGDARPKGFHQEVMNGI